MISMRLGWKKSMVVACVGSEGICGLMWCRVLEALCLWGPFWVHGSVAGTVVMEVLFVVAFFFNSEHQG